MKNLKVQLSVYDIEENTNNKSSAFDSVSTIQYLGNKARILDAICPELMQLKGINTFVDLFAGTGTVAYALKNHYKIYANDLQFYANVINQAILNGSNLNGFEIQNFFKNAESIYNKLIVCIEDAIRQEEYFFKQDHIKFREYKMFCDKTPNVFHLNYDIDAFKPLNRLCEKVNVGSSQQHLDLPVLFITYYANTYFGIKQCCEIDALRGAISEIDDKAQQNVLLTALMSTMSSTVSATTHFAQYLKIRDPKTATKLIEKRTQSIFTLLKNKINEFRDKGILERSGNIALCANQDYLEFLNSIPIDHNTLVYADPPYFKEHYSRYYHILETLCLYDYPEITFNKRLNDYTVGRYRKERAVSPFGKKSSALKAFNTLIETCAASSANIAISYSDNSIVKIDDIIKIAEQLYRLEIKEIPLKHSNQGRASISEVKEILIVGEPLKTFSVSGQALIDNLSLSLKDIEPLYDNPAGAMHNYMARKPYNIVNNIIETLLPEKGIVLDPFCGSGTSLIEARKLGNRTVGVDINQQAVLITKASLMNWDVGIVEQELGKFLLDVETEISHIYHVKIGTETRIIERCHFDLIEDDLIPTSYWYKDLQDGKLGSRKKAKVDHDFIYQYKRYEANVFGLFEDKKLLPNSRIAIAEGATVANYLCPRNQIAIYRVINILNKYKSSYIGILVELVISSALNLIKLSDKKASSQIPYWRPQHNLTSRNAYWIIQNKISKVIEGLLFLQKEAPGKIVDTFIELYEPRSSMIVRSPIQKVPENLLPNNSIDLVITDPPYTDQVPYLEYSQLWSLLLKWDNLSPDILSEEIVVSNSPCRKGKTSENFDELLALMFQRISKAMKQHSHMVLFFHDFSLKAWSNIIQSAENAGLAYQGQVTIGRQRKSFKTVLSPNRTLDGNYIVVFRKREIHPPVFEGDINVAIERCFKVAKSIIRDLGGRATSQDLYDKGLLKDSIESGSIHLLSNKYKTFLDIVKHKMKFNNGYWSEG